MWYGRCMVGGVLTCSCNFPGGRDFGPVAVPIRVTFDPLELNSSACVPIMTDSILEGNEEFTVTLVIPQAAADIGVVRGNPHMATITILDDDSEYSDGPTLIWSNGHLIEHLWLVQKGLLRVLTIESHLQPIKCV